MKSNHHNTLVRYGKFLLCNIPGTAVDLLVVWLLSSHCFSGYWGQYVGGPAIAYECGILVDYVLCYFFVWNERVSHLSLGSFLRHLAGYNLSSVGAYLSKALVIALLGYFTCSTLDAVWCDAIAMTCSGTVNFLLNERLIFRIKKHNPYEQ